MASKLKSTDFCAYAYIFPCNSNSLYERIHYIKIFLSALKTVTADAFFVRKTKGRKKNNFIHKDLNLGWKGLNILITEVTAIIQHILCTQTIKEGIVASSYGTGRS